MELLTRNNFEGWMQKLMERLDRQDELLLAMKAEGKQPTITESISKTGEHGTTERTATGQIRTDAGQTWLPAHRRE